MMNMNLRTTGASFVAGLGERKNPRDIVVKLIEDNPGAPRDQLFSDFMRKIQGDDDYERAVAWYFFVNMHDYLTTNRNRGQHRDESAEGRRQFRAQASALAQRVVDVVCMDLVLPHTGKTLRDSTFSDCGKAGGFFARVAKKGKPKQIVGKVLTEADLQKIR